MIAKRVKRDTALSSFTKLAQYIADLSQEWEKNKGEKVGEITITNCVTDDNIELATLEILATQNKNKRSESDKTYHMIVSFPASETPSADVLKSIETYLVASIGLQSHQRISVVHTDTDNLHIHVAINKVHPTTGRNIEPYFDQRALMRACDELEARYGLQKTNHGKTLAMPAIGFEKHTLEKSFITNVHDTALEILKKCNSWAELHKQLTAVGLVIQARGAGLVISTPDGEQHAKLSSVSKGLGGDLNKRLGKFEGGATDSAASLIRRPAQRKDAALFGAYLADNEARKQQRTSALSEQQAMRANALARIKQTHAEGLKQAKAVRAGRDVYAALSIKRKREMDASKSRVELPKPRTFERWLIEQATLGDVRALAVLRRRIDSSSNQARITSTRVRGTAPVPGAELTKTGSYAQRLGDGGGISTSHVGTRVDTATENAILLAARIELQYGGPLRISGPDEFRNACLAVLKKHNLDHQIGGADLPAERVSVSRESASGLTLPMTPVSTNQLKQPTQEKHDGIRLNRHTANGLRIAHASAITERPQANRLDSVRALSDSNVVRDGALADVLLPIHPRRDMEHSEADGLDTLRRPSGRNAGTGAGQGEGGGGGLTISEYIADRNKSREKISDIPYHREWNSTDAGASKYMGKRTFKDGVTAVLIERKSGELLLIKTDHSKTLKIGQSVTVDANANITKGRSR